MIFVLWFDKKKYIFSINEMKDFYLNTTLVNFIFKLTCFVLYSDGFDHFYLLE